MTPLELTNDGDIFCRRIGAPEGESRVLAHRLENPLTPPVEFMSRELALGKLV